MKDGVLNWCAIGTAVLAWGAGPFTVRAGLDDAVIESLEVRRSYAESGDPSAQYNMGITYLNGQGAPRDLAKAVDWFRKAAGQGIPEAQYNLAILCLNGEGLQKNEVEAVKWLSAAAVQGNFSAQKALIRCYADGIGVPKSPGKALLWDFLARRTLELREEQPAGQPERPPKLRADGAAEWANADGTRRALHADGSRETIARDGTRIIERRSGVKTQVAADGVEVSTFPDGSTERKFPDGKVVARDAKGTVQTKFPDGRKILEGKATTQDGREVEASQEYDKDGKLIASRISDTDKGRVQVSYSDKSFAFEYPAEDEKGEKVTLIEKYSAEGQLMARELMRADGRKREGQEEWTIKRWMPSPSSPRVKIQVLERYGLGGSVLKQEVLAEAKVEPLTPGKSAEGQIIVRQGNTVEIWTPAKYPVRQFTDKGTPPMGPARGSEEMSRGELRELPGAQQGMKTKRSIAKELGELAEIERNCRSYAGATDAEYEQARAVAARFTISMPAPPQKPVAASAVLARGLAASVTPPQQPPLVEIPNDLSSKYPLGMNGSEALKIRPWKHAETPHFVVHYAEASDALTVMRFIETAHYVVTQALGVDERAFKKKSHVFIFPDAAEWNAWLKKKDMPSSVAGYAYKDELLVGAQGEKDDYAKVVCHEATHAIVARYYAGRRWPLWLNEGFAEYMASKALAVKRSHQVQRYLSTEAESSIDIAQVINRLIYGVRSGTIPVGGIIPIGGTIPADSPLRKFYPNSEKMVRVLQEKLPAAAFPKFVNLLVAGNAFEVSLRETYGKSCSDVTTFKGLVDAVK
ncbi:hypothetical protein ACXR0O_09120 [Verrucomicrobiota bacterium sgz303538]